MPQLERPRPWRRRRLASGELSPLCARFPSGPSLGAGASGSPRGPREWGGSCAAGSVCSLWPHPSSGRSPHLPPKPLAADGISADFLWDSVPSTAPISSLSSGPSVHRSHIFTSRAALAWTWGSDGSVVRVISGLDGRGSPAGHTDKGCS